MTDNIKGEIFIIIFMFLLSSCGSGCVSSDDFGETNGKSYSLAVSSNSSNCSWSIENIDIAENDNQTITNCLKQTIINNIPDLCDYDEEEKCKPNFDTSDKDKKCANFDASNISETEGDGKKNDAKSVFYKCVTYCIKKCDDEAKSEDSLWSKADITAAGSNSFGVIISDKAKLKIKATGVVSLTQNSSNNELQFHNPFGSDIFYKTSFSSGTNLKLEFLLKEINEKNELKIINQENLQSVSSRVFLSFKEQKKNLEINYDYIDEGKCIGPDGDVLQAHDLQNPHLYASVCDEFKITEDKGLISLTCKNDYSRVLEKCTFNKAINKKEAFIRELNNNYDADKLNSIIFNDLFYKYSNSIVNNLQFTSDNVSALNNTNSIAKIITSDDGFAIRFETSQNNGFIDSYYWNKNNNFSFSINTPTKIAIKGFSGENCEYIIKEKNSTDDANPIIFGDKTSGYITYNSSNLWKVIKNPNVNSNNEIIFNQYSTPSSVSVKNIEISIVNANSNTQCNKLAIKLLPLKDFEIKETGIMFLKNALKKEEIGAKTFKIKYAVLNPNVFSVSASNEVITSEEKKYEFFENRSKESSFLFENEETETLTNSEIKKLDRNNYNNFINKGIFVRAGQVVRFDYSNWLRIDGKENIEIIVGDKISIDETNINTVNIPFGFELMNIIKPRDNLLCLGNGKTLIDYENYCRDLKGGEYKEIANYTENTSGNEEIKCFVKSNNYNNNCLIEANIVKELNDIYDLEPSCINSSSSDAIEETAVVPVIFDEFIKNLSSRYFNTKNERCFNKIIKKIFDKANGCLNILKQEYETFEKETTQEKGENGQEYYLTKYKKKVLKNRITENPENSNIDLIILNENDMIQVLNETFLITEKENGSSGSMAKYFENNLEYFSKDIGCVVYDKSESGECISGDLPICYDLREYVGSLKGFIKRTRENNIDDITILSQYGKLSQKDRESVLGAKLISSFNGSEGIINNFEIVKDEDTQETVYENDYIKLKNKQGILLPSSSYINVFYIKDMKENITDYKSFKNEYLLSATLLEPYAKGSTSENLIFKNGDRLAIFLGNNKQEFTDDIPKSSNSEHDNTIKYLIDYTNGNYNDANSLLELDPTGTGNFIEKKTNSQYIDLSRQEYGLTDPNLAQRTLFFKIIDVDKNNANNSGNYNITISSFIEAENSGLTNLFTGLFDNIIGFMDGKKQQFYFYDNKMIFCDSSTVGDCNIYNPYDNNVNGNSCISGDGSSYCYRNCNNKEKSSFTSAEECKKIYIKRGFVVEIYKSFTQNPLYQFIIKISLVLMLAFYGFNFFLGKSEFKTSDLIYKIVRVCFIYFIITEAGWEFFDKYVISFFKDGIDSLLFLIASAFESDISSKLVQAVSNNDFSNKMLIFQGGIDNLEILTSDAVISKVCGLFFSTLFGMVYFYFVISAIIAYIIAILSSIILYLNAQLYMSLVFSLFPLVVLFMMFDKTKKSLDNWFNMLVGFVFQQIFLILTISFFNNIINIMIKSVFSYRVCWESIFNLKFGGISLFPFAFWKIPNTGFISTSFNAVGMPNFYTILMLYIIGKLMGKFITGMVDLGSSIAGGGQSISSGFAGAANKVLQSGQEGIDKFMKKTGKDFVGGMANRVGLGMVNDYNKEQEEKNKKDRDSKFSAGKSAKENAEKKTLEYLNSDQFKKDKQESIDKYADNNKGKRPSEKDVKKIENKLKNDKYNESFRDQYINQRIEDADFLKKFDTDYKEYNDMSSEQKSDLKGKIGNYLESTGEVSKKTTKESSIDSRITSQINDESINTSKTENIDRAGINENNGDEKNIPVDTETERQNAMIKEEEEIKEETKNDAGIIDENTNKEGEKIEQSIVDSDEIVTNDDIANDIQAGEENIGEQH